MRLCNYCQAGMAVLPTLEIGEYIFCDAECAALKLADLEDKLQVARVAEAAATAYGQAVTVYRNNRDRQLHDMRNALLPIWSAMNDEKHAQAEALWEILDPLGEF